MLHARADYLKSLICSLDLTVQGLMASSSFAYDSRHHYAKTFGASGSSLAVDQAAGVMGGRKYRPVVVELPKIASNTMYTLDECFLAL
jgi:hypothetical protein